MKAIDYRSLGREEARLLGAIDRSEQIDGVYPRRVARLAVGGLGSLDPRGVGGDPGILLLDMPYVSARYRKLGIGRHLTVLLSAEARARGAVALYVSATPTRNTVEAYQRLGARLVSGARPRAVQARARGCPPGHRVALSHGLDTAYGSQTFTSSNSAAVPAPTSEHRSVSERRLPR